VTLARPICRVLALAVLLAGGFWISARGAPGISARAAEVAPPIYCLTADWPNLPAGLELGQVAGLGFDPRGVLYLFHRGAKSWTANPTLAAKARSLMARLFEGDTSKDPIAANTILAIDPVTGALLSSFGAKRFLIPHGLTVDGEDALWVTDVGLHQVFKLSRRGELLLTLGEAGVAGAGRTRFDGPTDVAVARDGSIYVADGYGNARVVKFAANGEYLFEWGGRGAAPGRFNLPHAIAIDAGGNVYVADRGNARIQVFDADGTFLRQISGRGIGRPWALEIAGDGRLYVVDGGDQDAAKPRSGLLVMTREGEVIARWSRYGYEPGNLVWPHDLAVGDNLEVFVGEVFDANRVQKFSLDCPAPSQAPSH
jgi:peptidylamidoglycolate lyase